MPNHSSYQTAAWTGCRVLNGATGELRWERRYPVNRVGGYSWLIPNRYVVGPDLDGDGTRELIVTSIRAEFRSRSVGSLAPYQHEEKFLYVDCFSGRDGSSLWWQRVPLGLTEWAAMTGTVGEMQWWGSHARQSVGDTTKDDPRSGERGYDGLRLVIPVHRHPDTQADAGTHSLYVLSAATGRVEHHADDLAFPKLVDWNNDGLDDLAVYAPDDPVRFATQSYWPPPLSGKWVALRGSPPEAFRRLDRWVEQQDFDGDGIAELSRRDSGLGMDYAVQIASGRDGRIMSRWKTEWPETPRSYTVGEVHSFPLPLGDFDGDGLADLLVTRDSHFWDFDNTPRVKDGTVPLLMQAISGKTGRRVWGGPAVALPEPFRMADGDDPQAFGAVRNNYVQPITTQAVDLDGDGRPELLQSQRWLGHRPQAGAPYSEVQQPFVALIDGRAGMLRWCEPVFEPIAGSHAPGLDYLRIDASTDLNGDGTRDLVLTVPQQDKQGMWSLSLQVQSGRNGKVLWGPKAFGEGNFNNNDFNSPIISDLDGDGRPELVLMPTKQPHVTVLRGDTGELLWTWKGSQPQYFAAPGIAVVADAASVGSADSARADAGSVGHVDSHHVRRCVAVSFNETGSQWNLVLLDHAGKELEKIPYGTNQVWSHDLDGDGGEELLRFEGTSLIATRGLHDVLWKWTRSQTDYGWVSRFDRTADGRAIVVTAGSDSVTLLDGPTGKPLGRTFKSTNTSLNENGRNVDLNHVNLVTPIENSRLLTRPGDGLVMLGHVVSRAVLPTDAEGRYLSVDGTDGTDRTDGTGKTEKGSLRSLPSISSSSHRDDPRLVRQLPWAPSAAEWAAGKTTLLSQAGIAISLAIGLVVIPFWLIRVGVRRKELGWWRAAWIAAGPVVFATTLALFHIALSGPNWRGIPLPALAAMGVAALPALVWIASLLRNLVTGEWRRLSWLLGGSLLATVGLAAFILWLAASQKPPEQRYSWHAWWFILLLGAHAVGTLVLVWKLFGPGTLWLWQKLRRPRSPSPLNPVSP